MHVDESLRRSFSSAFGRLFLQPLRQRRRGSHAFSFCRRRFFACRQRQPKEMAAAATLRRCRSGCGGSAREEPPLQARLPEGGHDMPR